MRRTAQTRHLRSRIGVRMVLFALWLAATGAVAALAADAKALSAQLSDEAFALLSSVSANHDHPSPLLGPVGVFAADAQKLSSALQSRNNRAAAVAMGALKSDAADVDKAAGSGGLDTGKWNAIKHDLDTLSTMVAAAPAPPSEAVAAPSRHSSRSPSAVSSGAGAETSPTGPKVRINTTEMVGTDVVRIRGSMSGRSLRSAGIYLGDTRIAKLDLKRVPGQQMVDFNIEIHNAQPGSVLRVYDSAGRSGEATIVAANEAPEAAAATATEPAAPPPAAAAPAPPAESHENIALGGALDSGSELDRSDNAGAGSEASGDNTREIPAATPPLSGPRRRMRSHLHSHGPNDIHVQIDSLTMVDPGLREYMVKGVVAGSDLRRAGIYVNGKLAQEIPINSGSGMHTSNFAQSFTAAASSEATIRVYRSRRDYTESSINLLSASTGGTSIGPVAINSGIGGAVIGGVNPGQLVVQITSVQAASPSLYVVNGYISGGNVVSAGIYQNGVLTQPLSVNSGGIGGLITGLIPGMNRQTSFAGRFNPSLGYATVRAYDSNGMMTEQPIMGAGAPYGYGGSPYGVSPYGVNPYGANPYGTNPYGVNPYGRSPYGTTGPGLGSPGVGVGTGPGSGPRTGIGFGSW